MDKIKNILGKLKDTEIRFKKPDLSNLKNKVTAKRGNIDAKEFYNRYRQQILTAFVAVTGVFFLFYWTGSFINLKINSVKSEAAAAYNRLEKAANMAGQIKLADSRGIKNMDNGLLSFIQETGTKTGVSNKLVNIRPLNASKGIEHVSLRLENLYYDEFVKFIAEIEKYDNLNIKSVNFTRRYDNPEMIDSSMEVVKM